MSHSFQTQNPHKMNPTTKTTLNSIEMPPKGNNAKKTTPSPAPTKVTQPAVDLSVLNFANTPVDVAIAKTEAGFESLSAHKNFPSFIKLNRDGVRGRYVAATQPIKAGTTILADCKPFSYAISDNFTDKCCSYCNIQFNHRHQPIKCSKCPSTLWCSRQCFNDAGPMHAYECDALAKLPELKFTDDTVFLRVIIRALYTNQLQKSYLQEVKAKVPIAKRNKTLAFFKPQANSPWEEFSSLMTHDDKLPSSTTTQVTTIMRTLQGILKLKWWDAEVNIYGLYLYLIMLINKFPIKSNLGHDIGHGLYLYPSYFNHSDSPNCIFEYGLKQNITIRALRDIAPGEELTHSYSGSLYEPSWQRRAQMRGLFHFDPFITFGENSRTDPNNRIKDDFRIAGLKCAKCTTGTLNYHQVKHYNSPQQNSVIVDSSNATATVELPLEQQTQEATTTTSSAVTQKEWFDLTKPEKCDVVTCYNCKMEYPINAVENWISHLTSYCIAQRTSLSQSMQKMLDAQVNLNNIVTLISKPTTPLTEDEFKQYIELYNNTTKLREVVNPTTTPPKQLFMLTSTHYIIYMVYQSLLFVAIQQQDLAAVHKYSQLLYICLSNPSYNTAMGDYHNILLHLGDSAAFLSGHYSTITGQTSARSQMIVTADVMSAQLLKAKEWYDKCLAIRRLHYGKAAVSDNQFIQQIETRIKNITPLIPKKK